MTRSVFGWSLPPGVTYRMIDEQCGDGPCMVCGQDFDTCICPECPQCGGVGYPDCYANHGLTKSPLQVALAKAGDRWWADAPVPEE